MDTRLIIFCGFLNAGYIHLLTFLQYARYSSPKSLRKRGSSKPTIKTLKAIKIINEYIHKLCDRENIDSPASISITPTYIGLREYLYNPFMTNRFVGSAGESVPRPLIAKLTIQCSMTINPVINTTVPA